MPGNDMGNVSKISLEISVTSNATAQIKDLTESVNSLIEAFGKTEKPFKQIEAHFNKLGETAKELTQAMQSVKELPKIAGEAQRATNGAVKGVSAVGRRMSKRPLSKSEAEKAFQDYKVGIENGTIERSAENFKELDRLAKARMRAISDEEASLIDKQEQVATAVEKSGEAAKKAVPWWQKLGKQMGRIALYRAVRMLLREIAQAVKTGVQNVALFDERTNEAISNIKNAWSGATNAFGSVFSEIIIMAEPMLTQLGEGLMDFGNNLAMVLAKLNGSDTYKKAIKNNEDYADSLKDVSGQLLSFDKFESLNAKPVNFVETNIEEDWNTGAAALEGFGEVLQDVIGGLTSLHDILTGDWSSWWKDLTSVEHTLSALCGLALAAAAAFGVFQVATKLLGSTFGQVFLTVAAGIAVFSLLHKALENLSAPVRVLMGVLTSLAGIVFAIFGVSMLATHRLAGLALISVGAAGILAGVSGLLSGINDLAPRYAAGGFPEDGLFYANHNELVGQFSNGKTAVANNQQIVTGISDGVYPAVYRAVVDAMRLSGGNGGNVYLDKEKVGRVVAEAVYGELKRVGHAQ